MKYVTQAEFARICGVNRSTVHRWIASGRIESDAHGRIDPVAADRMRDATESPLPHHQARKAQIEADKAYNGAGMVSGIGQGQIGPQNATSPATERNDSGMPAAEKIGAALKFETYKLQKAKAEMANLELDKAAGALVERAEVDFILHDFGTTLGGLLDNLPDRMTPECLRLRDVAGLHQYLAETFNDLRGELAAHMTRRMDQIT
jgi:phage terminase Nu1 subunit (DNA packaging protein)